MLLSLVAINLNKSKLVSRFPSLLKMFRLVCSPSVSHVRRSVENKGGMNGDVTFRRHSCCTNAVWPGHTVSAPQLKTNVRLHTLSFYTRAAGRLSLAYFVNTRKLFGLSGWDPITSLWRYASVPSFRERGFTDFSISQLVRLRGSQLRPPKHLGLV